MKNLYRLMGGALVVPMMAAAMRRGAFQYEDFSAVKKEQLPEVWHGALNVMQVVGGFALVGPPMLICVASGKKHQADAQLYDYASHLMIFHALPGVLMTSGEETVPLETGDLYWYDNKTGLQISNNSKDDCVFMEMGIKVE